MNYAPSVFILSPGQMLHINKGRLHAFRKLSPFALPSFDCHAELRAQLLKKIDNPGEEKTCTSIAWDWEFKGVTAEGIDQEVTSMLECSKLNRERKVGSLGVAETSILFMARRHVSEYKELSETAGDSQDMAFLPFKSAGPSASATDSESSGLSDAIASPSAQSSLQVLRGLLPSLSYVVDRHKKAHEHAKQMEANGDEKRNVSIAPRSDAQESQDDTNIDPWGLDDMTCKGCEAELSQCYMHCDGCEHLLDKDFNMCVDCHSKRKYECFYPMNKIESKQSSMNHVGDMEYDHKKKKKCSVRGSSKCQKCERCSYCSFCSCRCHKSFTMRLRFMSIEEEETLLQRVKDVVGSLALPLNSELARLADDEKIGDAAEQTNE